VDGGLGGASVELVGTTDRNKGGIDVGEGVVDGERRVEERKGVDCARAVRIDRLRDLPLLPLPQDRRGGSTNATLWPGALEYLNTVSIEYAAVEVVPGASGLVCTHRGGCIRPFSEGTG